MSARILIVEDDVDVSLMLTTLLESEGYDVSVAYDGLEGLLRLRGTGADLIILDLMMPDVSGARVLEQLLEEGHGVPNPPVVVVTGSPDGARTASMVLGSENVFEKPFEIDDLLHRIRHHLEGGPS